MATLTETEWDNQYTVVDSPSGESTWTEQEILAAGHLISRDRTWTMVDGDEDNFGYIVSGFHRVNAFGYVVTEQAWTDADTENEWELGK